MSNAALTWIIALVVFAAVAIWLFNAVYMRGATGRAVVRTGLGGRKVMLEGGMIVLPILHETTVVSLGLSKIALTAEKDDALITGDRMRVDVDAEFFLRVAPTADAVALAAATLGPLTNRPDELAAFYGSEFLGALRSVAAEREMNALHENRAEFVEAVRARAAPVLARNGLELSSVAIGNLDQTALEHFNPANRFDAEGLTQLIDTVEARRQTRNAIEQRSAVAIREANLAAERETLALDRDIALARLEQERDIEARRAAQAAEIAREQAERAADAEAARIAGTQATNQREIAAREDVERARVVADQALDQARIAREQEMRRLEIARETAVDIAKRDAAVAMLDKAIEEAEARIAAEARLTAAAKAEEQTAAARAVAAAERAAEVARIDAAGQAQAAQTRAAAEAEADRLRNEADNLLSEAARDGRLRAQLIAKLETVIAETVKPIEKIDGIKMVHMSGGPGDGEGRSPVQEVIDSTLRYRVQAPMIDALMKEIGVEGASTAKMGDVFRAAKDAQSLAKAAPSASAPAASGASGPKENDDA